MPASIHAQPAGVLKGNEMLSKELQLPALELNKVTQSILAERRNASRIPVIKSAKLLVGEGFSQGVYNCLVLDESLGGVLVDLGAVFTIPEEMIVHLTGGAMRRARRCWAVGTKVGLEYIGEQLVSDEAVQQMGEIAKLIGTQGLPAGIAAMRARQFFNHGDLREAAEEAEAAYYKLEALLRDR